MEQIPPPRRPHYPPTERLAILELRAARGWSQAQTATSFLLSALTISNWNERLDEEGPYELVQVPVPVSKTPYYMGYTARQLKTFFPQRGTRRVAHALCRAGLHLGATTVRRMLRETEKPKPTKATQKQTAGRVVTARRPNDVWHCDLTTVPTSFGF